MEAVGVLLRGAVGTRGMGGGVVGMGAADEGVTGVSTGTAAGSGVGAAASFFGAGISAKTRRVLLISFVSVSHLLRTL